MKWEKVADFIYNKSMDLLSQFHRSFPINGAIVNNIKGSHRPREYPKGEDTKASSPFNH